GPHEALLFGVASLLEQSRKPREIRRHERRLVHGEGLTLPRNARSSSAAERAELLSVGVGLQIASRARQIVQVMDITPCVALCKSSARFAALYGVCEREWHVS